MNETELTHKKIQAEIAKIFTENDKMRTEINKMIAETAKVNKDIRWYEVVIIVSATLAVVAIAKLFL